MCLTNLQFYSSSMSTDTQSCYRRKPLQTYKSPTADEQIIVLSSGCSSSTTTTKSKLAKSSSTKSSGLGVKKDKDGAIRSSTPIMVQCRCPRSAPLPLFHPFGKLARSLPPLDPTLYGLPVLAVPDGLEDRQSGSGRKKNGVGTRKRSRDVEEDVSESGNGLSGVAVVAAQEAKERTSPRKRRTGGGGNKRKRKDGDEADTSYPAKKTRVPRGSQNGGDDHDDAVEGQSNSNEVGGDVSDLVEKRRSTRNRGGGGASTVALANGTAAAAVGPNRRESSESETTTGSVTAQVAVEGHDDEYKRESEPI